MRHLPMAVLAALVALTVVTSGGSPLQGQQKEARRENPLLGTWKQVSGKFNGKEFRPPEGTTLPKHVTPAQFMFVDIDKDGVIRDAAGGSYALTASTYAETATYSIGDFHGLKGKTQSFTWKVVGNRWLHSGTLSSGMTLEEVMGVRGLVARHGRPPEVRLDGMRESTARERFGNWLTNRTNRSSTRTP